MKAGGLGRWAAEFVGTALLVGIGTGAIVRAAEGGGSPQWQIAIAWFLALALAALAFIAWSGAHFNPGITIGLFLQGRHARAEVLPYLGAQFAGAFLGTYLVLELVGSAAHLGATLPAGGDLSRTFLLEFLFSAALGVSVGAASLTFAKWGRPVALLPSGVVGISTWLIGPLTGSSLNPARTLAPAVVSASYLGLWVYCIAPPFGATLGLAAVFAWHNARRRAAGEIPPGL
ncbi:MAG TPA: aquaporin [Thermoplasmata archaeon]|nr:aquaporin [Thermoplasmata archaeon]